MPPMSESTPRKHIVISGTGRTGTSFLIQLLTHLELDTGFTRDNLSLFDKARAGLESDIRRGDSPYVVKAPQFCDYADEALGRDDIAIEHVLIPMRDLHAAAESRRHVHETTVSSYSRLKRLMSRLGLASVPGGLWHTGDESKQEAILLNQLYKLLLSLSKSNVPVTLLNYPRLVNDGSYLYDKLAPILNDIDEARFSSAYAEVVRPDWVHRFNPNDR